MFESVNCCGLEVGGGVFGELEPEDGCGRLVVELEPANSGRAARVVLGISLGKLAVDGKKVGEEVNGC